MMMPAQIKLVCWDFVESRSLWLLVVQWLDHSNHFVAVGRGNVVVRVVMVA